MFANKILLITGGTGSFGSTVLRRFLDSNVKEIRIFSRDEKKQEDMRLTLNNPKLKFYIGDVRDENSLVDAFKNVDFIFHAAALKQVPSCEFYPLEALKTNILGTENVLRIASKMSVKKVILLSTDKAVYPINAMGISKAMAEKVMVAASRQQTKNETIFCATRYGNVMASRGSVIPLFIKQIKNNEPITITDPNMTRFLMSLDNAVDLVMHAFKNGNQGDIFVQKSSACTVKVLAEALKTIFRSNVDVSIIGTRHGEKLFESLVSREEMVNVEDMGDYFRIPADNRDLNYAKYFSEGKKEIALVDDYTSHNTDLLDVDATVNLLLNLDFVKEQLNA
jgi:UDP-N-acetylglucosamine 4,6-dehydratase